MDCVLTFEVVDLSIVWVVYECNPAPDPVWADQCNLTIVAISRNYCVPKFEVGSSDVNIILAFVCFYFFHSFDVLIIGTPHLCGLVTAAVCGWVTNLCPTCYVIEAALAATSPLPDH